MDADCEQKIKVLKANNIHIRKDLEVMIKAYVDKQYSDFIRAQQQAVNEYAERKISLMLRLVNQILINIGKPTINNLLEFRMIDRIDILKEENKQALDSMADDIFKFYKRKSYNRKTAALVLNVLRSMCKEIGFTLANTQKTRRYGKITKTHYYYSIIT